MRDAPKRIKAWTWNGQTEAGGWHVDGKGAISEYLRADLIDMDVLARVEAALEDYSHYLEASEETNTLLSDLRAMLEKLK